MENMNWEKISQKIIEYSFYSLFFLVPLIMTPINYELFEYNKMMLVYFLSVVIVGAWLIRMILVKKILFCRTPFDLPIILFLVSQVLSTVFSMDVHTSIWGYYSRFHGGLLSTFSYIFLYYALVSNLGKKQVVTLLKWLLVSGVLVSLYGILEHFGIDAQYWVQDVKNRVFSTLGQPNWLAAWLAIILPLPLAFILHNIKNKTLIITYSLILITYLLSLIFTKSRSGIPSAFIGLAVFGFLFAIPKVLSLKKQLLLPLITVFSIIIIGIGFWGVKFLFPNLGSDVAYIAGFSNQANVTVHTPFRGQGAYGSSSGDIRKVVWRGAIKIFQAYPILGSGVETFAYSYYNFRPMEHNDLSEWDFLYNKAHNEYFNFLATTGIVGFGTYMLFIGWVMAWNLKQIFNFQFSIFNQNPKNKNSKDQSSIISKACCTSVNHESLIISSLFSGWLTILITNFFGFSVVPVALCFFLFPAFSYLLTISDDQEPEIISKACRSAINHESLIINSNQKVALTAILLITSYLLLTLIRFWYADTLFATGYRLDRQGYFSQALDPLQQAVKINPGEPTYHDELSWNAVNIAVSVYSQKQTDLAAQYGKLSLDESDKALKTSPKNLNFLKTRVKIYLQLANIDPTFYNDAITYLSQAHTLAPTDPKLVYNLGLIYYQIDPKVNKEKAKTYLEQALSMRPEYLEAKQALEALAKQL
jgi:putative inorganic carbon (hco3(-)) transporter